MAMPSEQITDEIWRDDLELKLFAAIRLARLVWPGMKQRKWGRIINVLNTGAKAPRANGAPTAVSRAAGMAFMKVLAGEGAPHGILVNGMLVGQIVSDQVARRHAREGTNVPFDEYVATVGKGIPVGRMGKAEEFAAMACFLCSDHAGFTTGTAINMDGGASPGGVTIHVDCAEHRRPSAIRVHRVAASLQRHPSEVQPCRRSFPSRPSTAWCSAPPAT